MFILTIDKQIEASRLIAGQDPHRVIIIIIAQNKGKDRENSYQKLKRSPEEMNKHTYLKYFDSQRRNSQSEERKSLSSD